MKYDVVCLYSIQGVITETTQVLSSLVCDNWEMIKNIPDLHAFLSLGQSVGNVGIAVLYLMIQVDNKIITSERTDKTDKTDNIAVSTTSTQLSEGGEDGDSGGNIAFQI